MNKPIELQNAKVAQMQAWEKYFSTVEQTKDAATIEQAYLACAIIDTRVHNLYNEWQLIGGTSDIETIALHDIDNKAHMTGEQADIARWQYEVEETRKTDRY